MKTIGEILESPTLSARLTEGRRLLSLQRAADSALAELGVKTDCRVAGMDGVHLELRVADAAAAARMRQIMPSFLSVFNRLTKTTARSARVRVSPQGGG